MATLVESCQLTFRNTSTKQISLKNRSPQRVSLPSVRIIKTVSSSNHERILHHISKEASRQLQNIAISLAVGAATVLPAGAEAIASTFPTLNPAIADVSVLIAGQPVKEPYALLRYALPIQNKSIRDVQFPLELVTEDLRVPGVKALDSVDRNVRQASRALSQGKDAILADVAPGRREEAKILLEKLTDGFQDFFKIIEQRNRAGVVPQQRLLLRTVGDIEEAMVEKFPFEIPEEFAGKPWLKGRARLDLKVNLVNSPTPRTVNLEIVVDGYNAPITAGNFVDLVQHKFYDGMEIQRADGFVVQTGDPEGPEDGFVDPKTGEVRTIPLELFAEGDKEPIYHDTFEELGRYRAIARLPFNAFGTLAMAREEFTNDSASSQIFWLLKESELTPSNANILDGRYAVFGYVVENQDLLADVQVGDVIESIAVVDGLENLVNPTY